jgi:hypothetical protein
MTMTTEINPEPTWDALNVRTLRESAKEVLEFSPKKRTLRSAYAEVYDKLKESGRELAFTCQNCGSLIDDEMEKCWACGLVFRDEGEEVVEDEVLERAKKLGLDVSALSEEEALERIEAAETKSRKSKENVDLLAIESKKLNERVAEEITDGWRAKRQKQFVAYFDPQGTKRFGIYHRGLKVDFLVEDGFLDGFPDVTFYDKDERRKRHFGRVNYQYLGDMANQAFDLIRRAIKQYS